MVQMYCPDCQRFQNRALADKAQRCMYCKSLNLERYLGRGRFLKTDAADVPENQRMVRVLHRIEA